MEKKIYNWVTLGCGVIANELARAMKKEGKNLYGVANRTYEKAVEFAKKYDIDKVYENIEDAFLDENVDIIYISTPHNTHIKFLEEALKHKKHVICEKSITLNSQELERAMNLARENGVILAEAMTIYHMPIYKKLKKIVESGKLGKLKMLQLNFGSYKDYDMKNRFFNPNLAGGALLDIGVYALSLIRWFMSEKPEDVVSQVKKAPSGVDEQAGILLMNSYEEMATVSLTLHSKQPKRATIAYDKGYIEIFEYPRGEKATITYTEDSRCEEVEVGKTDDALRYEIRDMEEAVRGGENKMCLDYTEDVMEIMTSLRSSWGLVYPEEM